MNGGLSKEVDVTHAVGLYQIRSVVKTVLTSHPCLLRAVTLFFRTMTVSDVFSDRKLSLNLYCWKEQVNNLFQVCNS